MGHFYVFFLGQSGSGRIQSQDCGFSGAQIFTKGSMQRHALEDRTPEGTNNLHCNQMLSWINLTSSIKSFHFRDVERAATDVRG